MKVKKLLDSINPLNDMVLFFLSKKKYLNGFRILVRFEGPLRVRFLHGLSYNSRQKMCFDSNISKHFGFIKICLQPFY